MYRSRAGIFRRRETPISHVILSRADLAEMTFVL